MSSSGDARSARRPRKSEIPPRSRSAKGKTGVFLDRDGVINAEVHLLHRVEQLVLLPGVAEAIRVLNRLGVRVVVVTNQPVVARGLCTEGDVARIHRALRRQLGRSQARLDAVYFCPHHENADLRRYRKNCPDRKPNIGMLQKAARRFGLELPRCFMIGDQTVDVQTGKNAGCRTILVRTGYGGRDRKHRVRADFICADLAESARLVARLVVQRRRRASR